MPHKHLKRQNVIQLHQSSDLNSNKTITECLTDKTGHVTAAQCIYNLHHGCGVELKTNIREVESLTTTESASLDPSSC